VSVVIADVAGSLAMAEALDPEDVHALMDGFFALALEAVHREGGTLNQFRGDGFMALFGAPRARGDDPARALRAALEVREGARAYGESVRARFGLPFAVRMGVSSGLVWVGAIGDDLRRDYTAEGTTVGLAARLEGAASPGQILVADTTARRCPGLFELADLGPRRFRGLAEPARVFELIGECRPTAPRAASRESGWTPFVGREPELATLARALGAEGGVRCVEIRGEAGIGKSRLAREAVQRLSGAALLELACRESGAERAYHAWLEALRRWPDDLPHAKQAARLRDTLGGLGGAPPEPEAVAASLRELLGGLLAERPVVLLIDDARWIDPSSRALLARLTADPPDGSLGVVALLQGDSHVDWGAAESPASLRLGPLSAGESRRLAGAVLAGAPGSEELAELAWRRGGGNPLFVEEVTRALREGASSLRGAGRAERSRASGRIPETLIGVVAARIDALPAFGKRLLEAAAALGEPAQADLLREIEPHGDVAEGLAELARLGLLARDARGEYEFCHGVVCSGAYAQLARGRRAALHGRIAGALARRADAGTPGGAARIGGHFERAGDRAAAALHLERAGDGYVALRALPEAAAQLGRALEQVRAVGSGDAGREAALGLKLAAALSAQDRSGEAAAVLARLESPSAGEGDRLRLAMARVQAGWVHFSHHNELERGRQLIESGLRLAGGPLAASDAALLASGFLARIDLLDGELERSLRAARRVRELGAARGDTASLVLGLHHEVAVHAEAGRVADARGLARQALVALGPEAGDLAIGTAQLALARVHVLEGDVERALAALSRVSEAGARTRQLGLSYHAVVLRGDAQLLAGAPPAAHEAFESLVALNDRWPSTWLHVARGRLAIGEVAAAAECAARCLASTPPRALRARALGVRGLALGLAGAPSNEAEALLAESASLCDALGLRPALAEAEAAFATLYARSGDRARAHHFSRRARARYERCGMPRHAALSGAAS
jgi:class 3 adenylate cyclase/tetratricopeptide (TPR) repeat protein